MWKLFLPLFVCEWLQSKFPIGPSYASYCASCQGLPCFRVCKDASALRKLHILHFAQRFLATLRLTIGICVLGWELYNLLSWESIQSGDNGDEIF